jgi:hypothetical protein
MYAGIISVTAKAGKDSPEETATNILEVAGWCTNTNSHINQNDVEYYKYPHGKVVLNTINRNDVVFTNTNVSKLLEIKAKAKG